MPHVKRYISLTSPWNFRGKPDTKHHRTRLQENKKKSKRHDWKQFPVWVVNDRCHNLHFLFVRLTLQAVHLLASHNHISRKSQGECAAMESCLMIRCVGSVQGFVTSVIWPDGALTMKPSGRIFIRCVTMPTPATINVFITRVSSMPWNAPFTCKGPSQLPAKYNWPLSRKTKNDDA